MGRSALVLSVLLTALPAAAETFDATVTTLVAGRQDPRDGKVYTVVPIYQLLTLSVSGVKTRWLDDLRINVSGWGELALGDPRSGLASGDLDVGVVDGSLFDRRVRVQLGRQMVWSGAARAMQLDGASLTLRIFRGIHLNAWGGAPVTPRFGTRLGDVAAGGRLSFRLGHDSDFGLSFVEVLDGGRLARQDLGVDARWQAHSTVALTAYALLSTVEWRLAEGDLAINWQPIRKLSLRADYRRTAPDLFLPRNSILSVFSQESRDEVGASLYARPTLRARLDVDYHAIVDGSPTSLGGFGTGHRGGAKANVYLGARYETTIGAEVRVVHLGETGYVQTRLFAMHRILPTLTVTLDADAYRLEQAINGATFSFTGAGTVGWDFKPGWRAVVSGVADVTPFVQSRVECMAKLVYNGVFRIHEVRP